MLPGQNGFCVLYFTLFFIHSCYAAIGCRNEESVAFEKLLSHKLRGIMLEQDLEEITSKQLRLLLESEMSMELKEYREFLDRQMLRILGQMERPSEIYDYLYLVRRCTLVYYLCE